MNAALPTTTPFAAKRWALLLWSALFLALTALLQLFVPYPVDDDTAYHFAVGQLIKKHGILHEFPWTPFSLQFDHYGDKEFLFHLLFVPLGGLGYVTAARLVGALAGAAALTALYLILRAERVKYAGLWTVLPLLCGEFAFRLALVRPHLLSIPLALVIVWAAARSRLPLLGLAAFIYPLSYVAFWQIPLIILVAVEAARLLAGERVRRQPAAVVAAGSVAGLLLHPNTINLLRINWLHMADVLMQGAWVEKATLNLGKELYPYPLTDWAQYLVVSVGMAAAAVVMSWKGRRQNAIPLAFALAAAAFGLLTTRSLRFVEYFVPFSVAAFALSVSLIEKTNMRNIVAALFGVSLLYTAAFGTEPYKNLSTARPYIDPAVASYFSQRVPGGSQVFTCNWDYTGHLMLTLPERRFIVAADPTLFYKKDPALYDIWIRIPRDAPIDTVEALRLLFRTDFVICPNHQAYWNFFDRLGGDPRVGMLFANERWVLFDLRAVPREAGTAGGK